MKIGKKILLLSAITATSLFGGVATVLPYYAHLKYDSDSAGSIKDKGDIGGVYFSYGNLKYLFDLDIGYTKIKYKNPAIKDLKQTDITTTYARYFPTQMYKIGLHHINTTDNDLGNGNTLFLGYGRYKFIKNDKISYGLDGYFSRYGSGYNENGLKKAIKIYQFTPYFSYSKALNVHSRNNIDLKLNYIYSKDFNKNSYTSLEISDTYFYDKFYASLKGYVGQMKAGVKDGGHTVYNTKDLYKNGFGLKLGYYAKKNLSYDVAYNKNYFIENGKTKKTSNDTIVTTLKYSC